MNWFKLKTDGTFLVSTGQADRGRLIPNENGNLVTGFLRAIGKLVVCWHKFGP